MADVPDGLTLSRHRDLVGRERRPWARWILLGALGAVLVAGLANAFGQRPTTQVVAVAPASLKVYSPERLRSGLLFESRFTIEAREDIADATLVLDPGWLEGMTLNTLAPGPVGEASRDGRLSYDLGHIPAGDRHLAHVDRTVTVFP